MIYSSVEAFGQLRLKFRCKTRRVGYLNDDRSMCELRILYCIEYFVPFRNRFLIFQGKCDRNE